MSVLKFASHAIMFSLRTSQLVASNKWSAVSLQRWKSSATQIKLPLFARALQPENAEKISFTDHAGRNFTYGEFGKKSAYLAKELKSLVPGQEERIAFLCDRDFSFPTTLAATWWAQHVGEAA